MTPKLPRVTARQVLQALKKRGFAEVRQSGSHVILKNAEGVRVTLPVHAGKIIHPAILSAILRDARLSFEEFSSLL